MKVLGSLFWRYHGNKLIISFNLLSLSALNSRRVARDGLFKQCYSDKTCYSDNLFLKKNCDPKITAFLKIKLLVPSFFLSDKVSEFRQTGRQVVSAIQTRAFLPLQVCCRIGTVYCTDCCSICATSGAQFAAESERFTVPIAAVFAPRLERSLLQNLNSLLYRLLQYLRHVWSAVCCRIGTVYCTDCCSICATSGAQFAAESERFTVPIAAVFAPRLERSLLQNRNSLPYRLLQYLRHVWSAVC